MSTRPPDDPTRAEGTFVGAGSIEDAIETSEAPALGSATGSDLARLEDRIETAEVPASKIPGAHLVDPDRPTVVGATLPSFGDPQGTTPFGAVLPLPGQTGATLPPPGDPVQGETEPFPTVLPVPGAKPPPALEPGVSVEGVTLGARERQDVLGTVFRAEHVNHGRCEVLALSEAANAVLGPKFLLDARLRSTFDLDDRRLPTVLALGSRPTAWAATRAIEGTPLLDLLEGDLLRLARLMADLADALDVAHRQRVVHGDLTPADVHVVDGAVRLGGFGRRAMLDPQGLRRPYLGGPSGGDAAHLAPEVATGVDPTPAADVYAVGSMLWVGLTGHPPYPGTPQEIRSALIEGTFVPGSPEREGLQAELHDIAVRCLARRPKDRYRDAGALATALREAVARHTASRSWLGVALIALLIGVAIGLAVAVAARG